MIIVHTRRPSDAWNGRLNHIVDPLSLWLETFLWKQHFFRLNTNAAGFEDSIFINIPERAVTIGRCGYLLCTAPAHHTLDVKHL
jgi:hypothetical protein